MKMNQRRLIDLAIYYDTYPELFFKYELDEKLDIYQEKIVKLFMSNEINNKTIGLESLHRSKTFVLAGCIWLESIKQIYDKDYLFHLVCNEDKMSNVLLNELKRLYEKSKLLKSIFVYEGERILCRHDLKRKMQGVVIYNEYRV